MLSDEEKREIEEEMQNYADRKSVTIDALKIVQRHRGWVSDEAIQDIAQFLNMAPADLDGVATFYNLIFRKPVGRHVIMVCNSISCWIMCYEGVRDALRDRLQIDMGQTTPDGRFTLLPNVCLGICDHAPALMIDEDTFTDLDKTRLEELLDRYQ
jgi:NADH-quinone oxidoreductase subunit E